MYANRQGSRLKRRGIVLVLILGMLSLLALIGVTFATFAGQSLVNNRNYAFGVSRPGAEQLMDYALSQLINDTNNPLSSLRGHSLLRDMYGNDSVFRGTNPQNSTNSQSRGLVAQVPPDGSGRTVPILTGVRPYAQYNANSPLAGRYLQFATNIPTAKLSYAFYGLNFTRWIVRLNNGNGVNQTFEVIEDDDTGNDVFSGGYHLLTLSNNLGTPVGAPFTTTNGDYLTRVFKNLNVNLAPDDTTPNVPKKSAIGLANPLDSTVNPTFVLDGRFMRAFNGPGMSRRLMTDPVMYSPAPATPPVLNSVLPNVNTQFINYSVPFNVAAYANFRLNGTLIQRNLPADGSTIGSVSTLGDPDVIGMDEDYDACDLENWFLAIQSADGEVMIPSFHRPGILTATDWKVPTNTPAGIMAAAKILRPRQGDNSPLFPADPLPDAKGNIKYDVDNDGDGVSDSVWLDLGYPVQRDPGGKIFKPLFAFMVLGQNGRLPLNTVGNLQARDWQTAQTLGGTQVYPNNYPDAPLWDHASHLGASVNEINPKYALQNAPSNVYGNGYSQTDSTPVQGKLANGIFGTPLFNNITAFQGVPVDLTQLRNILTGTYPHENPRAPDFTKNGEQNFVLVDNHNYYLPNNMADPNDTGYGTSPLTANVNRGGVSPVAGRWGEISGIPYQLNTRQELQVFYNAYNGTTGQSVMDFNNPVRAGRSFYTDSSGSFNRINSIDSFDDDFDSIDPDIQQLSSLLNPIRNSPYPARVPREEFEVEDNAGGLMLPVERERRFVNPRDPVGVGRVTSRNNRPNDAQDYGNGYDTRGRVSFFRYFRPPGVPQQVTYPATSTLWPLDKFNMAFMNGVATPDLSNNLLHGFESMRNPKGTADQIAVAAAMPYNMNYDWTNNSNPKQQPPTNPIVAPVGGATPNLYSYDNYVSTDSGPYGGSIAAPSFTVANGYPMGGLNKDEADEMNLYTPSLADSPFGPSDLEWLYRLQDVDGATLDSRLARLAPISFLNPADGLTRRRLFSLESWDLINFAYASDNPDNSNPWNSRFGQFANASFQTMNQVPALDGNFNVVDPTANPVIYPTTGPAANAYTTLFLPNPTFEAPIAAYKPNPNASVTALPLDLNVAGYYGGNGRHSNWSLNSGDPSAYPMQTPAVAHRDRRINLNQPLPISNDPAEPVRQKWVRETYEFLKAILPPQSVDTPRELAALSQFVVNIVDFRDPDCTMTRFINTDLEVIPATASSHAGVRFARIPVPPDTTLSYGGHHYPYDPTIYNEQIQPTSPTTAWWTAIDTLRTNAGFPVTASDPLSKFLVQHGMEYNPIALNEVLAYQTAYKNPPSTPQVAAGSNLTQTSRIFIELINTLTDANGNSASDVNIGLDGAGYDLVIAPDNDATCRPNPITGDLTNEIAPAPTASGDPVQYHSLINNTVIPAITTATPNYFVLTSPLVGTATINNEREEIPSADLAKFTTAINNQLPAQFAPKTVTGNGSYYWLYLRRSANPFDPTSTEKVVVDAIRFPVVNTIAQGTSVYSPANQTTTFKDAGAVGTNQVYSVQRLQPYRGGHKVGANGTAPIPPVGAYGYSEQTAPSSNSSNWFSRYYGRDTNNVDTNPGTGHRSSKTYFHTLGSENNPKDNDWDYLAFNDRDFASVAELLMVPGCPPGLFTKQFVEEDYPGRTATAFSDTTIPAVTPPSGNNIGNSLAAGALRSFPYLVEEFFYNAASVNPFPTSPMPAGEKYVPRVGEMTGAGWHKLLEFFEVPSSANGAIGSIASGDNFDWYREDRKPGLLNLNLIIDEEVFFGLIDDPRLNSFLAMFDYQNPAVGQAFLPQVVTLVDAFGFPALPANTGYNGVHAISTIQSTFPDNVLAVRPTDTATPGGTSGGNGQPTLFSAGRGFSRWDPRLVTSITPNFQMGFVHGLKAAFSDFLKIRHGGSGFLFAYGAGLPGAGGDVYLPAGTPLGRIREALAAERPFRSLSYPDINMTVMRPATLPASLKTFPNLTNAADEVHPDLAPPYTWQANTAASLPVIWAQNGTPNPFVGDPGVKNPYVTTNLVTARIPLVPSRRLFQIPDSNASSNAGVNGAGPNIMQQVQVGNLSVIESSLVDSFRNVLLPFPANQNAFPGHADVRGNLLGSGGANDNRQHPAYRIEWMQKVMNLTTVRTHQFAVWITIGFFEVLKAGSPTVGVPDVLGQELGSAAGKNVRYRSFFLLDRTRAAGFNPYNPGDFRDVVTYRRRIE